MIKCVIFDFGGTLVDFTDSIKSAHFMNFEFDVLKKLGYSFTNTQLKKAQRYIVENGASFLNNKKLSDPVVFFHLILKGLEIRPTTNILNAYKKVFLNKKESLVNLSPHAIELMVYLKKSKLIPQTLYA